ncbi:MAG: hypothetical protein FJX31_06120 [Alphaproteobacteria bacterium]|nr:hypothetical protein [Alphaproteobacteria bacterium]
MYITVRDPRRDRNLQRFVRLCATNTAADQLSRLRDALTLVKTTRSLDMVEAMIAACAFESAVLAVIGDNASWMPSKGGDGRCLASLILLGMSEELTSEGATPARPTGTLLH